MANKEAIMNKIARNMKQRGLSADRVGETVVVENGSNQITVSYVEKKVQSPMGGVDDSSSPFLGIGVAAPGSIKIEGAGINSASAASVGDLLDSLSAAVVLAECSGLANDIILSQPNSGAGDDLLESIRGQSDVLGLGQ